MISEINSGKFPVNKKSVHTTVENFCNFFKISSNDKLSIAFVDNLEIKKMNKLYRGINKPTDVLSFGSLIEVYSPLNDYYAEIIISYETAKQQALNNNLSIKDEIKKLLIHGLLHLIGYNHEKNKKEALKMEELECKILSN